MAASYGSGGPRREDGQRSASIDCEDFGLFQDVLKRLRTIDDRIINALNTSLPTDSFRAKVSSEQQCKDFYDQLHKAHSQRETVIKKCITDVSAIVDDLRVKRQNNNNDVELTRQLRKEQSKLRQMRQELHVEEVVQDRSLKEQCLEEKDRDQLKDVILRSYSKTSK